MTDVNRRNFVWDCLPPLSDFPNGSPWLLKVFELLKMAQPFIKKGAAVPLLPQSSHHTSCDVRCAWSIRPRSAGGRKRIRRRSWRAHHTECDDCFGKLEAKLERSGQMIQKPPRPGSIRLWYHAAAHACHGRGLALLPGLAAAIIQAPRHGRDNRSMGAGFPQQSRPASYLV
ncbi:MAG: hypothetical protein JWO94_3374 [Verrucomicrobiaceae bacterium]|nr:hypothetical protein [Verrucomicrobiaceae bacterium]